MMNTKIKAVIFDLDGTLIDTEKYYRTCWPLALEKFGYHRCITQFSQGVVRLWAVR